MTKKEKFDTLTDRGHCRYIKNQEYETFYKSRTIPFGTMAELGTVEKDASSHFGKFDDNPIPFQGYEFLNYVIDNYKFNTVLDVGAGECKQVNYLDERGKNAYALDLNISNAVHCSTRTKKYCYVGRFEDMKFKRKFDMTMCTHVLEHQLNVNSFLRKMSSVTRHNGYIYIVVPPRKPFITGGHYTMWNAGLVLYNLVMAGVDCSKECVIKQIDYDIGVFVKNSKFNIDSIDLHHDRNDIEHKLKRYFPKELNITEPFNGDIMEFNWNQL